MDLLVCGAPLDNSFHKDKLELVNKGSLGRRRKPTRANLKQLLSPSNHFSLQTSSNECDSEDGFSTNHVTEKTRVTNHLKVNAEAVSLINRVSESLSVEERTNSRNGFPDSFRIEKDGDVSNVVKNTFNKQNGEKKIQSKYSAEREALALHIAQKASSINRAIGKCSTANHVREKNSVTNTTLDKSEKTNHISENSSASSHILEKALLVKQVVEKTLLAKNTKYNPHTTYNFEEKIVQSVKQTEKNNNIPSKPLVTNGVYVKVSAPNRFSTEKDGISRAPNLVESSKNLVKPNVNGCILKEREKPKCQIRIPESSLPRTRSPQGSEGRSAVLIQTWERRSRTDSLPKRRRNKENRPDAMPERVRDPDEAVLCRITENGTRCSKPVQMKGKDVKNGPEPEWISLSRKLCAKYVEGNSELLGQEDGEPTATAHQPQSPHHTQLQEKTFENRVSASQEAFQQRQQPDHRYNQQNLKEDKDPSRIILPKTKNLRGPDGEPPWIHLSRKLCTKFIEEHIEFPVVIKEESKKEAVLVEPNGDVRIIEKIGQPKGRRSKGKKESEPEWVSLSRKLRAKFIESHIDDPDTISLENQLNASDPEETSSDSLQDTSIEEVRQKKNYETPNKTNFKGQNAGNTKAPVYSTPHPNRFQQQNSQNTLQFPDEDCSWEYQEMEFDQESDTFQEGELYEDPPCGGSSSAPVYPQDRLTGQVYPQSCLPSEGKQDLFSIDSLEAAQAFSNGRQTNSHFISNVECYNNDVTFAPFTVAPEKQCDVKAERKDITVQFISRGGDKKAQRTPVHVDHNNKSEEKSDNVSFFNLTTWEESHFESDSEHKLSPRKSGKGLRSKSMENVCEFDCGISRDKSAKKKEVEERLGSKSAKSEEFLDKVELKDESKVKTKSYKLENGSPDSSQNSSSNSSDVSTQSIEQGTVTNLKCAAKRSECSKTSQTDLHLLCNDFNGPMSNGHFDVDINVLNGFESLKPKAVRPECCKTSQTDLNLMCCEHQSSSDDSVSFLNGDAVKRGNKSKSAKDRNISEKRIRKTSSSSSEFNSNGDKTHYGGSDIKHSVTSGINGGFQEEYREIRDVSYQDSQLSASKKENNQSDVTEGMNRNSNHSSKTGHTNQEQHSNQISNGLSGMKKHFKCNGTLSNGSNLNPSTKKMTSHKKEIKVTHVSQSEMSSNSANKERSNLKQRSPIINEYANVQSSVMKDVNFEPVNGFKSNSLYQVVDKSREPQPISKSTADLHSNVDKELQRTEDNRMENGVNKGASLVKIKSKSLHDLSREVRGNRSSEDDSTLPKEGKSEFSPVKFQEFEFPSDIPLCAKLVSKQNGKKASTSSISSSYYKRDASPGSESSHVYEDMFKETTTPSDSEASSWTVMKNNNSYYINGRSSSMNDLDCSDSCSMSVKCDYASSGAGSGQSTLRSNSSFYVNLRDYDQHMLEPNLAKKKNHKAAKINSNPPTPESLRHLFTSPLSSIHPGSRLANRNLPNEAAESHYYSTATAASSAFKHGFEPNPNPKPKKTERSSSIKIKDIAHGIILTFRRFQNHSKSSSSHVSPTHYVDVSHLAESSGKTSKKEGSKKKEDKGRKAPENGGKTDSDSGCPPSDSRSSKPRRASSDLSPRKSNGEVADASEKKKGKNGKKNSNSRDKGKKSRSKSSEPRTIPTVSRKVQQMADGTLYLVTTVSGDTALPGVYSDSPDTSSELSTHQPVKMAGESNC